MVVSKPKLSVQSLQSVLIVEDRAYTAQSLQKEINKNAALHVVGTASDVATGLAMLQKYKPRFVLTDLGLPDGSGVEIVRAVKATDWPCDCMVISIFGDENRVLEAIRAGAKGFILKGDNLHDIGEHILEIARGGSPMSPKIARILLKLVGPDRNTHRSEASRQLTTRELDVLQLLAKGFKRKEIAQHLEISIGTVGTHINHIYEKLGVRSNVEAIALAVSENIISNGS